MPVRRTRRYSLPIACISLAALAGLLVLSLRAEPPTTPQATKLATTEPDSKQSERFAKLEKTLTGVTLVGHSTTTSGKDVQLEPETYELKSVKHVFNDQWLFQARIRYGEHDVTVPLTVPIHWADDTPVISVTNMGIPGLGTYTARVMIYADHYAGFWSGGDHGGHLFGVIKRLKAE